MNVVDNPAGRGAAATYNAAADRYDDAALGFWARHGQRAVARLDLEHGMHILDVGCGTGASALPAAAIVAPSGRVTGIDLAEAMLDRARYKAAARGLRNVTFDLADMTATKFADERFDAVISVFSLFFVPDMERQVAELWRLIRPGGQLGVTVWGPRAFEPLAGVFAEELTALRPDIPVAPRPWERLTDPEALARLLRDGGTCAPTIESVTDRQPITGEADWWTIAMGSGYRGQIELLTAGECEEFRARVLRRLRLSGARACETNAIHARVRKTDAKRLYQGFDRIPPL